MAEWFNAAVLKTVGLYGSVGSNPASSAKMEENIDIKLLEKDDEITKKLMEVISQAKRMRMLYNQNILSKKIKIKKDKARKRKNNLKRKSNGGRH